MEGRVGVPKSSPENPGLAEAINPSHRVGLAVGLAHRGRQWCGARPHLLDDVEFVLGADPVFGHALQNGMLRGHLFHRVPALVIVPPTGDSQKLPPLVDARSSVGVHRAVDGHCWNTRLMGPGDSPDVVRRLCVGEALVVNHHIEPLGPIGLIVEGDLGSRARAAFANDGPFHLGVSGYSISE